MAGTDPVTGRTVQRSGTFRGSQTDADAHRQFLASEHRARRSITEPARTLTVATLLELWLEADHPWRPSTWVGYESNARYLRRDRAACRNQGGRCQSEGGPGGVRPVRSAGCDARGRGWAVPGAALRNRMGLRRADHRHPSAAHDARSGARPVAAATDRRRDVQPDVQHRSRHTSVMVISLPVSSAEPMGGSLALRGCVEIDALGARFVLVPAEAADHARVLVAAARSRRRIRRIGGTRATSTVARSPTAVAA